MIPDYDDDVKMAALGRESARWKAIKKHKEAIRDLAVAMQGYVDVTGVKNLRQAINEHIDGLIEALEL
jgi:hypothetical protein